MKPRISIKILLIIAISIVFLNTSQAQLLKKEMDTIRELSADWQWFLDKQRFKINEDLSKKIEEMGVKLNETVLIAEESIGRSAVVARKESEILLRQTKSMVDDVISQAEDMQNSFFKQLSCATTDTIKQLSEELCSVFKFWKDCSPLAEFRSFEKKKLKKIDKFKQKSLVAEVALEYESLTRITAQMICITSNQDDSTKKRYYKLYTRYAKKAGTWNWVCEQTNNC